MKGTHEFVPPFSYEKRPSLGGTRFFPRTFPRSCSSQAGTSASGGWTWWACACRRRGAGTRAVRGRARTSGAVRTGCASDVGAACARPRVCCRTRGMQASMAVTENFGEACPASAPFFGYMGAAAALIFASACPARRVPRSRRLFWRALVPRGALSRARGAAGHRTVAAAAQERCAASWPTRGAAPCGWPQTHASDGGTGTPCGARLLWGAGAVSNPMRRTRGACGVSSHRQRCARALRWS